METRGWQVFPMQGGGCQGSAFPKERRALSVSAPSRTDDSRTTSVRAQPAGASVDFDPENTSSRIAIAKFIEQGA